MLGLPDRGQVVKVWPAPGCLVPMMPGSRQWLPVEGRDVVWTPFHVEQLRAGEIFLHDPNPKAPKQVKGEK
jgi:hypothetical protein